MTTTETNSKLAPVHPGEVLMEDFIEGFGITQNKLAVAMAAGVPIRRLCHAVSATPPLARSGCDSLSAAPARPSTNNNECECQYRHLWCRLLG